MIAKPIQIKPLENYQIWLKYSDNTEGTIDLSHLVGKGIFSEWGNIEKFKTVFIDAETNAIAWNKTIELCPNSLYLKIKGKSFSEWQIENAAHASNK